MSDYPSDLRYTRDHEWARKNSDGTLTIGITSYAAKQIGDVVFVDVSSVGRDLEGEEDFGTIESVKAVSELFMPVGGRIVAVNDELDGSPELVNEDPYGDGWIVKVTPSDAKAYDGLMTAAKYEAHLKDDDG